MNSAILILAYTFFTGFVGGLYELRQIEEPYAYFFLSRIGFVWLIWLWLREDSRRRGITWMLDLGMFLLMAWPLILPYHLVKTRGFAGLIPILWFILAMFCGAAAAAVVSVFML